MGGDNYWLGQSLSYKRYNSIQLRSRGIIIFINQKREGNLALLVFIETPHPPQAVRSLSAILPLEKAIEGIFFGVIDKGAGYVI